ncbi:MAG TPA: SBBP repeat-containing protein, partial [Thermoanaerobaculia bacterium]
EEPMSVDANGWLLLPTAPFPDGRRVNVAPPHASQTVVSKELDVRARWKTGGDNEAAFIDFGPVDASIPLDVTFDVSRWAPATPAAGGAFGATGAIATDAQGNVYVAGRAGLGLGLTDILGLPNSVHGPYIGVAKFDPSGKLSYTTLLGSTAAYDTPVLALAPDGKGNIFVAMAAGSDAPLTRVAQCTSPCVGVAVVKLGGDGELVDSSLVTPLPEVTAMAVDPHGAVYVVARQPHDGPDAAATSRGFIASKPTKAVPTYAAKIERGNVVYATYLAGLTPVSVTYTPDGKIVVGGNAVQAPEPPATAYRPKFNGGMNDGYVMVIDPSKSGAKSLVAATYIGGGGSEDVASESVDAVAVDSAGNVYAGGVTAAPDFPTTGNALDAVRRGERDGFVCKFDPQLKTLRWSTLIGGSGNDSVTGLSVDRNENVYVVGDTDSGDFRLEGGPADSMANSAPVGHRLFLMRVNSLGSHASWSLATSGGSFSGGMAPPANLVAAGASGDAVFAIQTVLRDEMLPLLSTGSALFSEMFLRVASCVSCSASPSIGRITTGLGGTVTIEGDRFDRACKVQVDGVPSSQVTFLSPSRLEVPIAKNGTVEISVVNPDGESATASVRVVSLGAVAGRIAGVSPQQWRKVGFVAFWILIALVAISTWRRREA